jgi:hypothetical protein
MLDTVCGGPLLQTNVLPAEPSDRPLLGTHGCPTRRAVPMSV